MSITFSSCFYIMESKFTPSKYIEWIKNIILIANNFNLVIYTDQNTVKYIDTKFKPNIKIVIKPINEFYNYKYKKQWIHNHENNTLLNKVSCWELNMLWAEKINLVKETIERTYFETDFYGWCDIGYFRNRRDFNLDTNLYELMNWPNVDKINALDKNKIVYACINNDDGYINDLIQIVHNKNTHGLPTIPIPPYQHSIAGGCFILHRNMINWWFSTFNQTLESYFKYHYLVKDDQIIIADCVFSNLDKFTLYKEYQPPYDNWFMFQRIFN